MASRGVIRAVTFPKAVGSTPNPCTGQGATTMASPLIPGLSFRADDDEVDGSRTFLPAAGQMLLVTDDLASTADFLLHSGLVQHLKANGSRAVLVSSNDVLHWKNVSAKMVHPPTSLRGTSVLMPDRRLLPPRAAI